MKTKLLLLIGLVATIVTAQTNVPFSNQDFETGVGATTWDGSTGNITATELNSWTVNTQNAYRGVLSIVDAANESLTGQQGSGVLKVNTSTTSGQSFHAKIYSEQVEYTPSEPINGATIKVDLLRISPISTSNKRPKFYLEYFIDNGAKVETALTKINLNSNVTAFDTQDKEFTIEDVINTSLKIRIYFEFGKSDQIFYIDDVKLTVTEGETLSTDDYFTNNTNCFPNPVKDVLYFSNSLLKNIRISNVSGTDILTTQVTSDLDLSTLTPGIYFIKITDPATEKSITKKIIKQ